MNFFKLKYNRFRNLRKAEEFFIESLEEIDNPYPEYEPDYLMEFDDDYVYLNYESLVDYYKKRGMPSPNVELGIVLSAIEELLILKNREQIMSELI